MIVRDITLPLRLVSLTNQREHWSKKYKRSKVERGSAGLALRGRMPRIDGVGAEFVVTIGRIAPRKLDDDNLRAAAKSVRDGVADFLGIDDGDARIEWRYEQMKGKPKEYACRIRIERKEAAA